MKQEEICILKLYLSEDEIRELVIEEYRSVIREEIKDIKPEKRMSNHDRVISNAVYYFLEEEVDKIVGTNTADIITDSVKKALTGKDLSYSIFRTRNAWDSEDSIGVKYLKEAVTEQRQIIKDKVAEQIAAIDFSTLKETIIECMCEVVNEKLKA